MAIIDSSRALLREELKRRVSLGFVRDALWRMRALRDNKAVRAISRKLGLKTLSLDDFVFSPTKSTGPLFILGSGSSINELTEQNFHEIGESTSVGINVWIAHDFVPDAYSLESGTLPVTSLDKSQRAYLAELLKREAVVKGAPRIIVLRPAAPSILEQFIGIPEPLRENTYLYGRANLPEFAHELGFDETGRLLRHFLKSKTCRSVVPDNGASVVRLIFLGLKLGFKKIVLVGVDLNLSPYFWFSPDWERRTPELAATFPRPSGVAHDTTQTVTRPHNTLDVIRWISVNLVGPEAPELFAGSSTSELATFLPTHPWRS